MCCMSPSEYYSNNSSSTYSVRCSWCLAGNHSFDIDTRTHTTYIRAGLSFLAFFLYLSAGWSTPLLPLPTSTWYHPLSRLFLHLRGFNQIIIAIKLFRHQMSTPKGRAAEEQEDLERNKAHPKEEQQKRIWSKTRLIISSNRFFCMIYYLSLYF